MLAALTILLPIFGLIGAGYLCRRFDLLGPAAAGELNRFVVWLALPSLLFDIMAHARWADLDQPGFAAAFGIACAAVFVLTLLARLAAGRHIADASVDAIAAAYPNVGFIGIPMCLLMFGSAGLTPATIATILVVCVLFALASVLIEVGLQSERNPRQLPGRIAGTVARNPLVLAPLAGVLFAAMHWRVPDAAQTFIKLAANAASPCALVSLGLFLAQKRPARNGAATRDSLWLAAAKLFLQPALTWWLAARVFALPLMLTETAVLLAALPTGTGPFMLAEFYRREAAVTSRTILLSTVMSLASLSALLLVLRHG